MRLKAPLGLAIILAATCPTAWSQTDDGLLAPTVSGEVRLIPAPAHIAPELEQAALHIDAAGAQLPTVMAQGLRGVTQHGAKWFLLDDPVFRQQAHRLGLEVGHAARNLAEALRKDMVRTAQASSSRRR